MASMVRPSRRASLRKPATAQDLRRLPGERAAEVVDGELIEKAAPSFGHGDAQGALLAGLRPLFHRRGGGRHPGGWWIVPEVEIQLETHQVFRPDVAGWRRERVPEMPRERPVRIRPDWVCEVLSESNKATDVVRKFRVYHRCGVPHYWVVDPEAETLTVHRWQPGGYMTALVAARGERVRAEPFEALEWPVGVLFGDEPEDDEPPRRKRATPRGKKGRA